MRLMMQISPKAAVNVYHTDRSAVTEGEFAIPDFAPYIYFAVIGADGSEARTQAYKNPSFSG